MRHFLYSFAIVMSSVAYAAEPTPLTLADFTNGDGGAPSDFWKTEEGGVIHLTGKGGNLISKLDYTNFELTWDWKLAQKANNGIKYWVTKVGGKEWLGIEYQMIDDGGHPDGMRGSHSTAAFYDIKEPASDKPLKPVGEWNSSKVVAKDGKLEHWLNGKRVAEADISSEDWKARVAASKFKKKEGFAPGSGRIMLTEHGNETWFRNIKVEAK